VSSGLPCDTFHFEGFLPHKKGRQTRWKYLAELEHTVVLYESPFRLLKCLEEMITFCGPERPVTVCREISKLFEEKQRGSASTVKAYYEQHPDKVRGEIVVVMGGKAESKAKDKE
jgi:16S rRNA (cytidine1402-2'-O)-methyltransferase